MQELESGQSRSIVHLPVGTFSIPMGLGALATAFHRAAEVWTTVPAVIGEALAWLTLGVLAALLIAYGTKAVRHRSAVAAEWRHDGAQRNSPVLLGEVPQVAGSG
ncbi:hypothetical protein LGT39_01055, partial [Demequina sp. TTPB684]|uniref:SLAC1 family transporter n=1 Tax=unclassified Demequina TaxID=2620311 RepID=UPI001CF18D16|nr:MULTISPECIES: hypothetical protein [unclassified Demequina]MCB2411434.1 hypothetical protein [Demequina sp. TTPB684]UPU87210.1 hypothetical protein LGT36_007955 [Demequina sp. TMPB413]